MSTLIERLRAAKASYQQWQRGIPDDGPSGAARCLHLFECVDEAIAALEAVSPAPGEADEATKRRLYADRSILRDELMKGIGKIRVKNTAHVTPLRPTLGESLSWSLVRDIAEAAIDIQAAASPPTSPGEPPQSPQRRCGRPGQTGRITTASRTRT